MVPNGWKKDIIGNHIDLLSGFPFKSKEYTDDPASIRLLRGDNVAQGYIRWTGCKRWENNNGLDVDRFALEPFDLVIAMDRTWVSSGLKISEIKEEDTPSLLVQRVSRLRANGSFVQGLLKQIFNSYRFEQYVKGVQTETAVPHISAQQIKEYPILLPPLPEQKKIARILSTWDKAIETVDKLIENSQQQKKALMQQLLTGKKRLPGFSGEWKEVRLGKVAQINPKKSEKPSDGLVSFVPMDAVSASAQIISLTTRNYDDVSKGFSAFADDDVLVAKITPCFENGKGAQATGLVNGVGFGTTEFHVIRAKQALHPRFIYYITNSYEFRFRGEANMQGSAGQRRVPTDFIKAYQIDLPPLEEQEAICTVLDANTSILQALHDQKAFATHEKQALMQQLLTGKRRVEA